MKIFNGKKAARDILVDLKKKTKIVKPKLAVILVGKNPESELYVKLKRKTAEEVGVKFDCYRFLSSVKEKDIISKIESLNNDKLVNGIIVQFPLPKNLKLEKIIGKIDPKKDVDGFHKKNRDLLKKGKPYFFPVLPSAILVALKKAGNLKKKKIIALVNSQVFGESLRQFFLKNNIKVDYFVKKTPFSKIKKADVVISVCGRPSFIKGEMVKKGVILIDGGITRGKKRKVFGDIDRKSVEEKTSFLTPVPGGLGPLTVALLFKNVYLAKKL